MIRFILKLRYLFAVVLLITTAYGHSSERQELDQETLNTLQELGKTLSQLDFSSVHAGKLVKAINDPEMNALLLGHMAKREIGELKFGLVCIEVIDNVRNNLIHLVEATEYLDDDDDDGGNDESDVLSKFLETLENPEICKRLTKHMSEEEINEAKNSLKTLNEV